MKKEKKKREKKKKKEKKKEKKRRNIPSPVPRTASRQRDSSGEESPTSDSFSLRREKDRGNMRSCKVGYVAQRQKELGKAHRATGELDYFSAYIRLREPGKSEDKAEKALVRKEVDSEECHSVAEADLPIAKKGTQFDYSTTAIESSWEPRGVLQPMQKIENSASEEMQRLQRLQQGRRRNNWASKPMQKNNEVQEFSISHTYMSTRFSIAIRTGIPSSSWY
ncbi:hypothetical protein BHE74_00044049, partial [Ensete ventricosum]